MMQHFSFLGPFASFEEIQDTSVVNTSPGLLLGRPDPGGEREREVDERVRVPVQGLQDSGRFYNQVPNYIII
jgi:hypothetical protein